MQKSYYFQHDYNASGDAKILFLRQQLGMEGYGIYWFILEQLAQSGGILPLKIIPVLAMQSQTQETKVKAIIEGYELFQIVKQKFFSERLNDHLLIRKHLSEKGKEGATLRWGNRGAIGDGNSNPNAKERKGNKGKESKEIKEREYRAFAPPSKEDVINIFNKKLDEFTAMGEAEKFINFYESKNWFVGKNKMKNWAAAVAGWVSRMNDFKNNKNGNSIISTSSGTSGSQERAARNF